MKYFLPVSALAVIISLSCGGWALAGTPGPMPNDPCDSDQFGQTQLSGDRQQIVACLENESGTPSHVWKSGFGAKGSGGLTGGCHKVCFYGDWHGCFYEPWGLGCAKKTGPEAEYSCGPSYAIAYDNGYVTHEYLLCTKK